MAETINPYILGKARYQVTAPCIVAQRPSGQDTYVYRDAILPNDVLPSQIERLLASGMIRAVEGGAQ